MGIRKPEAELVLGSSARPSLQELGSRHQQVLRMLFMGASSKEAAQETGFSEATVSLIKRSEVGQKKLEEMNKELDEDAISTAKAIHELIPQAISVYEDILSGEDQTAKACDKLRAADAVCDRGGLPRVSSTNINGQIGHVHATAAEITAIKERAIKIAREAGLLVDVRAAE